MPRSKISAGSRSIPPWRDLSCTKVLGSRQPPSPKAALLRAVPAQQEQCQGGNPMEKEQDPLRCSAAPMQAVVCQASWFAEVAAALCFSSPLPNSSDPFAGGSVSGLRPAVLVGPAGRTGLGLPHFGSSSWV